MSIINWKKTRCDTSTKRPFVVDSLFYGLINKRIYYYIREVGDDYQLDYIGLASGERLTIGKFSSINSAKDIAAAHRRKVSAEIAENQRQAQKKERNLSRKKPFEPSLIHQASEKLRLAKMALDFGMTVEELEKEMA